MGIWLIGITTVVILTYVAYNITYSLTSMPAGILSDRIGRRNVMVGGFLVFSLVYLGFAQANQGIPCLDIVRCIWFLWL
jgi:MFS family permease